MAQSSVSQADSLSAEREGQGEGENFRRVGSVGNGPRLSLTPTLSRGEREHWRRALEPVRAAKNWEGEAAWAA